MGRGLKCEGKDLMGIQGHFVHMLSIVYMEHAVRENGRSGYNDNRMPSLVGRLLSMSGSLYLEY